MTFPVGAVVKLAAGIVEAPLDDAMVVLAAEMVEVPMVGAGFVLVGTVSLCGMLQVDHGKDVG